MLEKLEQINGVYYNWKVNEFPENKFSEERQIGVIAQELEAVYPELVITDANSFKTVDYPKLTAILVQANKELKRQVSDLSRDFGVQDSKVQQLESDMQAIKALLNLGEQVQK